MSKGSCPIKTSPEWTASVESLGENNTWKLWMDSPEGDILPPVKGAFYLYVEANPRAAADLLNEYISLSKKAALTNGNKRSLTDIILAANPDMFQDERYQNWLEVQDFAKKIEVIAEQEVKEVPTAMEELEAVPDGSVFAKPIDFINLQNQLRSTEITYVLAQLAETPGLPFEMITADEARVILQGNPYIAYNNQAVFSLPGKTYYVTDNINVDTEFADMVAPFIAKMADLQSTFFDNQFKGLFFSVQARAIKDEVRLLNPQITDENSAIFKELVFIQLLKKHSDIQKYNRENQESAIPVDEAFTRVTSNILGEIRKSLGKQFPAIERRGLTTDTTLNDILKLFKNANYSVAKEEVTNKDLKDYKDAVQKGVEEILEAVAKDPSKKALDLIIENFIFINNKQLNQTNDPVFWEIKKSLSDESGRFLRDISERLKYLRKENSDTYENLDEAFKAKALVSSLFTLEKTLDKINEFLEELKNREGASEKEILDTLEKVAHYNYLLQGWSSFIKSTEDSLIKSQLNEDSSVYNLLARLNRAVSKGSDTYKAIQRKGATKSTTALLKSFTEKITADINAELTKAKQRAPSSARDKLIKELEEKKEKYNFTEDKIQKMYRGELGDASFWSSMFESYSTNPDPIIASFTLFLKGHTQEILNTATTKATAYVDKARPLMQRLGMDNVNFKKDWQEYMMIDKKPTRGEDGRVTYQTVLTFQAPVKDYRFELAKLDEAIRDAEKDGDKSKIKEAVRAKEDHLNKYFNRKYNRVYYEALGQLLKENPEAYRALEAVNLEIEAFKNANPSEIEFFMKNDDFTVLQNKRKQLYSTTNEDGTLKDAKNLAIAEALQRHGARTRKFYKSVEKPGAFQRAFESFLAMAEKDPAFENMPKYDALGELTAQFKEEVVDKWLKQNTVRRYSEAYYIKKNQIYDELKKISDQLPEKYQTAKLFEEKMNLLKFTQDENGQTDPSLLGASRKAKMARLKEIQEEINKINEERDNEFFIDHPDLQLKFDEAIAKFSEIGYKEPNAYYLEEFNQQLAAHKMTELDTETANSFISTAINIKKIEALKEKDPAFKTWFDENHLRKEKDEVGGKRTYKYERLSAWSVGVIKNPDTGPSYYTNTTVMVGTLPITVPGVPINKYFYTSVKDSYVNENGVTVPLRTIPKGISDQEKLDKYVGKVITNTNVYLPLSQEQFEQEGRLAEYNDPKNDLQRYRNNDYYTLKQNRDKFELLELTKKYHLSNQIGIDRDQKLYLDLPRYPIKTMLEGVQSGQIYKRWVDRISSITAGIKATLSGKSREEANVASEQETDVVDEFANPDTELEYEQLTMLQEGVLNPVLDKIGIRGIQKLDIEKVSYDVIAAVNIYMLQTEKQKVYNKISPLAQAIANTLEDTDAGIAQLNGIKEKAFSLGDTAKHLMLEDGKSIRASAFRAFMNREFKGQQNSGRHLDWLNKVTAAITGGASMNYFALNLPSAIKNYWGMLWQMNVEAVAGEYFDFKSMGKGKVASKIAMNEWSTRIWGGKYNTLYTQMIMRFDPTQGKAEEALGTNFSRTFAKDLASVTWVYSPRKFMEMEGGLQLFFSMMHHVKITDASGSKIDYAEAWELDKEGRLALKAGFDPAYGITYLEDGTTVLGEEFKKFQNRVHEKFKDLNGTFAKFEQPQAQLFFAYRLFAFMRRYFTSMFMNRFGSERANHALETIRTGYYIEAVKSVAKMITSFGQHAAQLAPSERRALLKTTVDLIQIFAISAIAALLFGYDDKDEDRFEKLRAKSGALGDDDFRLAGWLSNHALTLLLKTQQENQSFIPLPTFGLNNYIDFTSSTSIAFGPTIHGGAKLLNSIAHHAMPGDDPDLYYKKDMGPYPWQKEGEAKVWSTLGNMVGLSGTQTDIVKGLESNETYSKR